MMPSTLNADAVRQGLRLEPAGQNLAVFPKGKCPPDFAQILRKHKTELLKWLSSPPCPGWRALPPEDLPMNPIEPAPAPRERDLVTRNNHVVAPA